MEFNPTVSSVLWLYFLMSWIAIPIVIVLSPQIALFRRLAYTAAFVAVLIAVGECSKFVEHADASRSQALINKLRWKGELNDQKRLLRKVETAETNAKGAAGAKTATVLGEVAWHALLVGDFDLAAASSRRAFSLTTKGLSSELVLAHATMFLNKIEEARTIYLKNRGKADCLPTETEDNEETEAERRAFWGALPRIKVRSTDEDVEDVWEHCVLSDFSELRKAGLTHPLMKEVGMALVKDNQPTTEISANGIPAPRQAESQSPNIAGERESLPKETPKRIETKESGQYFSMLSSVKNPQEANSEIERLRKRFSLSLKQQNIEYYRVTLEDGRVRYRVGVRFQDRGRALVFCGQMENEYAKQSLQSRCIVDQRE